jgi:hypothetical protein
MTVDSIFRILALSGVVAVFVILREACRSWALRGILPPLRFAPIAAAPAFLFSTLALNGTEIFTGRFWDVDHLPMGLLFTSPVLFFVCLILAGSVVMFYSRDEKADFHRRSSTGEKRR